VSNLVNAGVVKLVNTPDLKSVASACRFESDRSYQLNTIKVLLCLLILK
jgi:hypothetical protein